MSERRYTVNAADRVITLADVAVFLDEMVNYRKLPPNTPVRGTPIMEFDMDGARMRALVADPAAAESDGG